jgi:nicotinate-nucleotide adenylyltransferase
VDTVEHFRAERPDARWFLLLGADSFVELDQWRRFEDLVAAVELVVLTRPGFEQASAQRSERLDTALDGREVHGVERRVDVSSTRLRARLAAGETPGPAELPPPVLEFCRKYSLYR